MSPDSRLEKARDVLHHHHHHHHHHHRLLLPVSFGWHRYLFMDMHAPVIALEPQDHGHQRRAGLRGERGRAAHHAGLLAEELHIDAAAGDIAVTDQAFGRPGLRFGRVPHYYCQGPGDLVDGRGTRHMNVGGQAIDAAVAEAFLAALAPAALQACLTAARQLEDGHAPALAQWHRQVEQARYNAAGAERRYRAVDPDNRLVARGLETEWDQALREHADAEAG